MIIYVINIDKFNKMLQNIRVGFFLGTLHLGGGLLWQENTNMNEMKLSKN